MLRAVAMLVFLGVTNACFAFHCVVIRGKDGPGQSALKRDPMLRQDATVAGVRCHQFDSWADAKKFISGVRDERKILIHFSTHGGEDAIYCKKDTAAHSDIFGFVSKLSQTKKVGLILDACNSGNIFHYLLNEVPTNNWSDNLCVLSSSLPNQVSTIYTGPLNPHMSLSASLASAVPTQNLEDVFLSSPEPSRGLISSAAWEDVGFSTLSSANSKSAERAILSRLAKYVNRQPDKAAQAALNACMSGSDEVEKVFAKVVSPVMKSVGSWREFHNDLHKKKSLLAVLLEPDCADGILKTIARFAFSKPGGVTNHSTRSVAKSIMANVSPDCAARFFGATGIGIDDSTLNMLFLEYRVADKQRPKLASKNMKLDDDDPTIVEQILGDKRSLCNSLLDPIDDVKWTRDLSQLPAPVNVLRGFIKGSLQSPQLENPIDARRRQACRSFTFQTERPLLPEDQLPKIHK